MRIGIFPFANEAETVLRYGNLLEGHQVTSVYVRGAGENGEIPREFAAMENVVATTNMERFLDNCEKVLLLERCPNDVPLEQYSRCLGIAQQKRKRVTMGKSLFSKMADAGVATKDIEITGNPQSNTGHAVPHIIEIPAPVIAVLGVGEHCDKFECQLLLKRALDSRGYNSLCISSSELGVLFGMSLYPDFIFCKDVELHDKVIRFNHYLAKMCEAQKPDVIVVGIPGGITPLAPCEDNYFAEIPYIISNALEVDSGILCIYHHQDPAQYDFDWAAMYARMKFNIPLDYFFLSRHKMEYDLENQKIDFSFLDQEYIENNTVCDAYVPLIYPAFRSCPADESINCYIEKFEQAIQHSTG